MQVASGLAFCLVQSALAQDAAGDSDDNPANQPEVVEEIVVSGKSFAGRALVGASTLCDSNTLKRLDNHKQSFCIARCCGKSQESNYLLDDVFEGPLTGELRSFARHKNTGKSAAVT